MHANLASSSLGAHVRRAALLSLAALATACVNLAPPERAPKVAAAVPRDFSEPEQTGLYAPAGWWRDFGDPALDRLVAAALDGNLDLAEAAARVAEARANAAASRARLLPSLGAEVSASRTEQPGGTGPAGPDFGGAGGAFGGERLAFETYSGALQAGYEIDFWGEARNARRAALNLLLASEAQARAARLSVTASVIEAYLDVTLLRRQIELAVRQIDVVQSRLAATQRRYERGLSSSFELALVRRQYRASVAQLPALEAQLTQTENALALSLGRYPQRTAPLLEAAFRPRLPMEPPAAAAPVALLALRPDVLAAARALEAARLEVGVARAQLFPGLSVSAAIGAQGTSPGDAFDPSDWFTRLGATLTAPLFQGGRLRAQASAAQARYAASASTFSRAALRAFTEVETAYARFESARRRYVFLAAQTSEAEATLRDQADRYAAGLLDYIDFLDAEADLVSARLDLAQAGRDFAGASLGVHRALGGDWSDAPGWPTDPDALLDALLADADA